MNREAIAERTSTFGSMSVCRARQIVVIG